MPFVDQDGQTITCSTCPYARPNDRYLKCAFNPPIPIRWGQQQQQADPPASRFVQAWGIPNTRPDAFCSHHPDIENATPVPPKTEQTQ